MIFGSEEEASGSEICLLNQLFHTSERALWNTDCATVSLSNPTFYSWWHEYEKKNPFIDLLNW